MKKILFYSLSYIFLSNHSEFNQNNFLYNQENNRVIIIGHIILTNLEKDNVLKKQKYNKKP